MSGLFGSGSGRAERAYKDALALLAKEKYAQAAVALAKIAGSHPAAAYEFAKLYEAGNGVVANLADAAHWYAIAADGGHPGAMARMGSILLIGTAAANGDSNALFPNGQSLKIDPPGARAYAVKAAEAGNIEGLALAGYFMAAGIGGPVDAVAAERYYRPAAEAGNIESCLGLGTLYAGKHLGAPDPEKARPWLEKAAIAGNSTAQYYLGLQHINGYGGSVDRAVAARYFTDAALQGHAGAMRQLAMIQLTPGDALADAGSGLDWLNKAGRLGDREAMRDLALRHRVGNGVRADSRQALVWLERAAKAGDTNSQFELGVVFATGNTDAPRDFARATHWSQAAANAGHSIAKINLGRFRMQGLGGEKDPADALKWLNAALADGEVAALAALGELHAFWMDPPDIEEARRLFARGAEMGDARCRDHLSRLPAAKASGAA